MVTLHPLTPELLDPGWAERVAAPAVDAMGAEQLRALAAREPSSFLHVTGLDSIGAGRDTTAARAQLDRLHRDGAYRSAGGDVLALLRLEAADHTQLGVVGDLHVDDVDGGRLRRHERTEAAKTEALRRHREGVGVDASPLSAAFRDHPALTDLLAALAAQAPPSLTVTTADGVTQQVWLITEPEVRAAVSAHVAELEAVYVLDGHHRLAAAAAHAERVHRDRRGAPGDPDDPFDPGRILSVLFPEDRIRLLDHRRIVRRPPEGDTATLLAAIGERFALTPQPHARGAQPRQRGQIALRLDGAWYRLQPRSHLRAERLPDRLDEVVVQRHLLEAVLGVPEAGTTPELSYVAGTTPLEEVARRAGPGQVIVALHPLPLPEMRAVADAGAVLPPKSTYVAPKPGAGLLVQRRGRAVAG